MFCHYLLGRNFILRTDHSSLTWLFCFKTPPGTAGPVLEELSQYDFTIAWLVRSMPTPPTVVAPLLIARLVANKPLGWASAQFNGVADPKLIRPSATTARRQTTSKCLVLHMQAARPRLGQ